MSMLAPPFNRFALFCVLTLSALPLTAALHLTLLDDPQVKVTFTSEEETLHYERPLIGTLEITSRAHEEVILPELQGRFRGFALVENFAAGRVESGGNAKAQWRFQLTPKGDGPWDLRPFVLRIKNKRTGAERSCLTRLVSFPAPPPLPSATGAPEADLTPEWVAPGWRTIRWWVLIGILLVGIACLIRPCFVRIRRAIYKRTLSPEAFAKRELDKLLAEGLLAKGQFKRFFYGLTDVVRIYFELGYHLRATRQTSQEFLHDLARDARVSTEERAALAQFLTTADAIKFAEARATVAEAEAAIRHVQALLAEAAAHRQDKIISPTNATKQNKTAKN